MTFPSINIQGNIVSGEILDKITSEDIKHQNPESFGLTKNIKVRDEVGLAWASARGYWQAFKLRRERIPEDESGTTETRNFWMLPFLLTLGYEVDKSNAENLDGKTYAISHRAANLSGLPTHIMGINDSLDKRRESSGPRLSPHGLVQEYLNKTDDYLYALVTNGKHLRLLRDATRLVRLTYLEFDLEKMMEEELFADFAVLYRILHASRMPKEKGGGEESIIEYYHQESLASGTRIREKLSEAVESSIKRLGNGFLKHKENSELKELVQDGSLAGKQYYLFLLRLIYRFLFLLVTEDRNLVYSEKQDEELAKLRKIYYEYYSMGRVRNLALRRIFIEGEKHDLWENIKVTFQLFESEKYGEKLGIKPLGSGIFHSAALGILSHSKLKNEDFLFVIYRLCYFMDDQRKQLVKVNYGDLDVEEFGSVYQGLLEFEPVFTELETTPSFGFVQGSDRSSSGSHYTPEELVRPLIQHSLEYIIQDCIEKPEERLKVLVNQAPKKVLQERALLAIKVADISCGSGHILLSAARRIGTELAKVRTGEDQPTPSSLRHAVRDVIRECIYGVDKNPLAVELCKVALWLEAHSPGEPLNFLDHKIKCGDAIVGLAHKEELERGIAEEAFKALPGDDKSIATLFRNRNREELKQKNQVTLEYSENVSESVNKAIEQFQLFKNLPERTPEEIEAKQKKFAELNKGAAYARLKSLADMQVAQFFIPKTSENKGYICTDSTYRKYLREKTLPNGMPPAKAEALSQEKGFFHYFIEFPEVFSGSKNHEGNEGTKKGGFDCVLGNPPYLGGSKISGFSGNNFLNHLRSKYQNFRDKADLVSVFFQRIFEIIASNGFSSLITTNSISEGVTREASLDVICKSDGVINFAQTGLIWPGQANVVVTLVSFTKRSTIQSFVINGKETVFISPYLNDSIGSPFKLEMNSNKIFYGSKIQGNSFFLNDSEINSFDHLKGEVIFKCLNASVLLNKINDNELKWVVNFSSLKLEEVKFKYGKLLDLLQPKIRIEKEEFQKKAEENKGNLNDRDKKILDKWWQFEGPRVELYKSIKNLNKALVISRVTKTHAPVLVDKDYIYSDALLVVSEDSPGFLALIQSSLHDVWAWNYSSKLKSDRRYSPSEAFETFPFLKPSVSLEEIGKDYLKHRERLIKGLQLGLTKIYNYFNNSSLKYDISKLDFEPQGSSLIKNHFNKELGNLRNHFLNNKNVSSWEDALNGIVRLRELHKEMDESVLEAYGWTDIHLRHDFYEVDYLPENDRVRYTIHPDARKEILKRLLILNHQYFEEEPKQGLHKQKDVEAFYEQKGKPVPEEVSKWYVKGNKVKTTQKKTVVRKPQISLDLFNQPDNQNIMKEFGLHEGIYSISDAANISGFTKDKVRRWFKELAGEKYEGVSGFDPKDIERSRISFHGIIELVVIGTLREFCKLKDILKARHDLGIKTGKTYPFANNNVDKQLSIAGSSIIFQLPNGDYITLNGTGQYNFEFIKIFFADIKFNKNGIAERLIPSKGNGKIAIDPKLASGKPFLLSTDGVSISAIKSFYKGPQSIPLLKNMYEVSEEDIIASLEYSS